MYGVVFNIKREHLRLTRTGSYHLTIDCKVYSQDKVMNVGKYCSVLLTHGGLYYYYYHFNCAEEDKALLASCPGCHIAFALRLLG